MLMPWATSSAYSKDCTATKIAPMMKVRANHSIIPHRRTSNSPPARRGWRRSAAKTPNWQVTELSTRTMVLARASGMLSLADSSAQSSGAVERRVKYMAKRPAKNISSEASHTMVPTEVRLGRLIDPPTGLAGVWVAVVTETLCRQNSRWTNQGRGRAVRVSGRRGPPLTRRAVSPRFRAREAGDPGASGTPM